MANIGDTVTFNQGAYSGYAPGAKQWNIGGSQGKITELRNVGGQNYYNIDQRANGGGTGWVHESGIGGSPTAATAPAPTASPIASTNPTAQATPAMPSSLNFAQTARNNLTDLFSKQRAEGATAISDYSKAIPGIVDTANSKYGVPGLAQKATEIQNRIDELRTNSNNTGTGGYSTAGQVDQYTNSILGSREQQVQNQLQTAQGLAQNEIGYNLKPLDAGLTQLSQRQAREATGYTTADQNELDTILKKEEQGFTLNENEKNRASQLALKEMDFKIQAEQNATTLKAANIQANASIQGAGITAGASVQNNAASIAAANLQYAVTHGAKVTVGPDGRPTADWSSISNIGEILKDPVNGSETPQQKIDRLKAYLAK